MESTNFSGADALLSDFLAQDDVRLLARDAGRLLNCPLLVLDDTFRIAAHYRPDGFADALFDSAVRMGQITYEAGAFISKSPLLSEGKPDYIQIENSDHQRRFALLVSSGVRLGYLICVDAGDHLRAVPEETFRMVEAVLAKQLFMEATRRDDRPFETAEEILMHLLDGGFASAPYFRLQTAGTYLADFHPAAFALIDLSAYHAQYLGKSQLKDELIYRFRDSHPLLYKGDVFLFLQSGYSEGDLAAISREFHLKAAVSDPISDLYALPALYRAARETLEDAVCLAALERRFGAALRDGAQPGEASAQAMRDYLCGPLSGAVYSLVMTLDVELCVLAGIVPGALGMQLCTQVSEALRAALPESTPVRVEPSVSADAGVIGAAATVFERSLDALLGSG